MRYTQGIMNDGAAILNDGQPMTPEQIIEQLNNYDHALRRVTRELKEWNVDNCDEDSTQAIRFSDAVLGA